MLADIRDLRLSTGTTAWPCFFWSDGCHENHTPRSTAHQDLPFGRSLIGDVTGPSPRRSPLSAARCKRTIAAPGWIPTWP